jgi:hypothetical protein
MIRFSQIQCRSAGRRKQHEFTAVVRSLGYSSHASRPGRTRNRLSWREALYAWNRMWKGICQEAPVLGQNRMVHFQNCGGSGDRSPSKSHICAHVKAGATSHALNVDGPGDVFKVVSLFAFVYLEVIRFMQREMPQITIEKAAELHCLHPQSGRSPWPNPESVTSGRQHLASELVGI